MKHLSNRQSRTKASPASAAQDGDRSRVLVVEREHLTKWSVSTYLQRWFAVETAESAAMAKRLVADRPFAALLLSDDLPVTEATALRALASEHNPDALVVRMVSGVPEALPADPHVIQLEKPFELSELARLLGVSAPEISTT